MKESDSQLCKDCPVFFVYRFNSKIKNVSTNKWSNEYNVCYVVFCCKKSFFLIE